MNTDTSTGLAGTTVQTSPKLVWFRRILSLFIIYHLVAVVFMPNPDNALVEKMKPVFKAYWMGLEFGSQWNFFAPEPGPSPLFIQYEIFDKNNFLIVADRLPSYPDDYFFRDRQIRRLSLIRYVFQDDNKIYAIILPWLCRQYPDAESVTLKKTMLKIPSMIEVAMGERKFYDENGSQTRPLGTMTCEGRR